MSVSGKSLRSFHSPTTACMAWVRAAGGPPHFLRTAWCTTLDDNRAKLDNSTVRRDWGASCGLFIERLASCTFPITGRALSLICVFPFQIAIDFRTVGICHYRRLHFKDADTRFAYRTAPHEGLQRLIPFRLRQEFPEFQPCSPFETPSARSSELLGDVALGSTWYRELRATI
jgi:hypothetical protein